MQRPISLALTFLCLALLAGCNLLQKEAGSGGANENSEYDDDRNPMIKKAQDDLAADRVDNAVSDYEMALTLNPKLNSVHSTLGQLYADKLDDPTSAIYHFKRFLAADPNSDKAPEVKSMLDKEMQSLQGGTQQNAEQLAKLQTENGELKKDLEETTQKLVGMQQQVIDLKQQVIDMKNAAINSIEGSASPTPRVVMMNPGPPPPPMPSVYPGVLAQGSNTSLAARATPADPNAPVPSTTGATPAPQSGDVRTYTVVSGDSLWKIAHKMYPGDTKNGIDKIKDANKDTLKEGKPLKVGQVLVIP